jgi:hypothetical protein
MPCKLRCSINDGAKAHGAIRGLDNSGTSFLSRWFVIDVGLADQHRRPVEYVVQVSMVSIVSA